MLRLHVVCTEPYVLFFRLYSRLLKQRSRSDHTPPVSTPHISISTWRKQLQPLGVGCTLQAGMHIHLTAAECVFVLFNPDASLARSRCDRGAHPRAEAQPQPQPRPAAPAAVAAAAVAAARQAGAWPQHLPARSSGRQPRRAARSPRCASPAAGRRTGRRSRASLSSSRQRRPLRQRRPPPRRWSSGRARRAPY